MRAADILEGQTIHVKRGRFNSYGFEPCWNSFFDFYLSPKYVSPPLLELQDVTFFLYLRKNLNDKDPSWKMPTLRQMKKKFQISQGKIEAMIARLEAAHLLRKVSGLRTGQENERNDYLLSDPVQTLEEFLTLAAEGMFPGTCTENRYMVYPKSVHEHVPETGTDQQTLTSEQTVWLSILETLKLSLPATTFTTFFDGTDLLSVTEGVATIKTSKPHSIDWIENRMGKKLCRMIENETKQAVKELRFEFV